jgi:sulfite exporter TauE/SafE
VNAIGFGTALLMGLFGSTHCVLMCGGVVGALCAGTPVQIRTRPLRQAPLTIGYNAGRVTAYAVAGLLAGGIGALVSDAASLRIGPAALRVFAALFVLGMGLHLAGVFAAFSRLERVGARIWLRLQPIAQRMLPVRTASRAFAVGLCWGAMPCGLVYSALVLALGAGSALDGALTMVAFGLGTLPMLFTMSAIAGSLAALARRPRVRHTAGFLVGAVGATSLAAAVLQLSAVLHGSSHVHCH